MYLPVVAYR